jgi:hypothetical protein
MAAARTDVWGDAALLLPDGRVLVAGGNLGLEGDTGEIYDPSTGKWTATADMAYRRSLFPAVLLNDGTLHTVHYSIIEDGGFAGFGQGVEWCVTGLDRNWAYNPNCKAARP